MMVISPLQQPLLPVIVSETQAPQHNVGFSSCKFHAVFITASPADTQVVCLAVHFPILVSGKHSQQGLNQTKSNRTEEFGDSSKWITIPPAQGFQYWKLKNDWQQKAVLIKAQQSVWIFPFWQWTFRSEPKTAGKFSHYCNCEVAA